jgi:hypothetical protein
LGRPRQRFQRPPIGDLAHDLGSDRLDELTPLPNRSQERARTANDTIAIVKSQAIDIPRSTRLPEHDGQIPQRRDTWPKPCSCSLILLRHAADRARPGAGSRWRCPADLSTRKCRVHHECSAGCRRWRGGSGSVLRGEEGSVTLSDLLRYSARHDIGRRSTMAMFWS